MSITGITKNITYTCSDGKVFEDEIIAQKYEKELSQKSEARYESWVRNSYSGKKLLANHKLDEFGTWRIRGEDPNCDLGGVHHQPELGIVEGTLEDIIKYAVKLPNFYTWAGGGDISKVKIKKV